MTSPGPSVAGLDLRWRIEPVNPPTVGPVDTTLVVTTFERPAYVRRLLGHLWERGFDARLLLVDASRPEVQAGNRELLASLFPEAQFLSLPSSTSLAETYKIALHSVRTEFLAYCPDDDFFEPGFLSVASRFLREHPDYVLCTGRFCLAWRSGSGSTFGIQSNQSVEHDDPLERFSFLVENYWPTLRSVQRTTVAIDAATALDAYTHHSVLGEGLHGSIYALYGKLKVLDAIGPIQVEHGDRNQANDPSARSLFVDDSFRGCVRVFESCVESRLALTRPGLDRAAVRARLHAAMLRHLANNYWLWRDALLADIRHHFPTLGEERATQIFRDLIRALESELLPCLRRLPNPFQGSSYEAIFKTLHLTPLLKVDLDGAASPPVDIGGEKETGPLRDAWLHAREELSAATTPDVGAVAAELFAPEFVERYAAFRAARLDFVRRSLGRETEEARLLRLCDALTVIAILERIGRMGCHRYELAGDVTKRLEAENADLVATLAGVATQITRHPEPFAHEDPRLACAGVRPPVGGSPDARPPSGTLPRVAA